MAKFCSALTCSQYSLRCCSVCSSPLCSTCQCGCVSPIAREPAINLPLAAIKIAEKQHFNHEQTIPGLPTVPFSAFQLAHPDHHSVMNRMGELLQQASFVILTVDDDFLPVDAEKHTGCSPAATDPTSSATDCPSPAFAIEVFETADRAISTFFQLPATEKLKFQTSESIDGGHRKWKLGYHHVGPREYFVSFATQQAQRNPQLWWPSEQFVNALFGVANVYKDICLTALESLLPTEAATVRKNLTEGKECSIIEAFFYPNDRTKGNGSLLSLLPNCPPHIDPGLLSIEVASKTPGLECFDLRTERWVAVDALCRGGRDLVLMVGGTLEDRSKGVYKATRHRVVSKPQPRMSYLYELLPS